MGIPDPWIFRFAAKEVRLAADSYTVGARTGYRALSASKDSNLAGLAVASLSDSIGSLALTYSDARDVMSSVAAAFDQAATKLEVLKPKYNAALQEQEAARLQGRSASLIDIWNAEAPELALTRLEQQATRICNELASKLRDASARATYSQRQRQQSSFWHELPGTFKRGIVDPIADTIDWVADTGRIIGKTSLGITILPALVLSGTADDYWTSWKKDVDGYVDEHVEPIVYAVSHPVETAKGLYSHYKENPGDILIDGGMTALMLLVGGKYGKSLPRPVQAVALVLNPPGPLDILPSVLSRAKSFFWFEKLETGGWSVDALDSTHPTGDGHLRDRHVDISDSDLTDRALGQNGWRAPVGGLSSKFFDESTASSAFRKFVSEHADEIESFFAQYPNDKFERTVDLGTPIGYGYEAMPNSTVRRLQLTKIRVALVRNAAGEIQVMTAFPAK